MCKIGIDAMGGDFGLDTTIPAVLRFIKNYKDVSFVLFGDEDLIKSKFKELKYQELPSNVEIKHTTYVLPMGEKDAIKAVRTKHKEASMLVMMQAAKDGLVDGCLSSGPTQCLVTASHLISKRLQNVSRLALCPLIPNYDGNPRLMLDVGANISLKPEHLSTLAVIATQVASVMFQKPYPTISLLNIGSEDGKGRDFEKEAFEVLKNNKQINFCGNSEASEILNLDTDIVITDGFTGNIALKTMEGVASVIKMTLEEEIRSSFRGRLGYLFMRKNMKRFKERLSNKEYGGALMLGLGNIVVKAHGNSDVNAYYAAILQIYNLIKNDTLNKIITSLDKLSGDQDEVK